MSEPTAVQVLQYGAINLVNNIIECRAGSWTDKKRALELVREHLDARMEQCWTDEDESTTDPDEDLL